MLRTTYKYSISLSYALELSCNFEMTEDYDPDKKFKEDLERAQALSLESLALEKFRREKLKEEKKKGTVSFILKKLCNIKLYSKFNVLFCSCREENCYP